MNRLRVTIAAGAIGASLFVGGVAGAALTGSSILAAHAAPTTAPSAAPTTSPPARFMPNEDPAHEAGESAAREAEEDAGRVPKVP